ncbi:hypothetical protein B0H12DRAFT_1236069 [Mycena haematopus]|nr:hypothetical protein B0H12DRAFT_1236069 [Mycena haematopus]
MFKTISLLTTLAVGAAAQLINGTAIEFFPHGTAHGCPFAIEADDLALLLSPQTFTTSLCSQVTNAAVVFESTVQTIHVAGICHACEGTDVAISKKAWVSLGAPEGTAIEVIYELD